jgi:phosphotransferase system enzyme I (PtsI)
MVLPQKRSGVAASPGIAIGPAFVLRRERLVIPEYRIDDSQVGAEVSRLERAFEETRTRLEQIREDLDETGLVGDIFNAQFLFLEDPTLRENATQNIRESWLNAEWALQRELHRLEGLFESVADAYIRERSSDAVFVVRRVLQALMGREPEGLRNAPPGVIVVAEDLSPAEVAQVTRRQIAGFLTESGSRTSHVTIMARSLELPAVVGAGSGLVREIADGAILIIDGRCGYVIVDPDPETIAEHRKQLADFQTLSRQLLRYVHLPAETRDGVSMRMLANVDLMEEIPGALRYGAEGIGLYRTEFLFMNRRDLPNEEEQFAAYRQILEAVAPRSAVIRTLDLGGEKLPTALELCAEPNPALGLRGVRMSHSRPDLFRVQLRALVRASRFGRLKVLLPMVSA